MKVAILSSGPSLPTVYDESMAAFFDAVIGVNLAPVLFRCDWWVAVDAKTSNVLYPSVIGQPKLVVYENDYQALKGGNKGLVAMRETDLMARHTPGQRWSVTYSITTAVLLAVDLGASHVQVFGHDMRGEGDAQSPNGKAKNRSPARWAKEARLWDRIVSWAAQVDISVERSSAHA